MVNLKKYENIISLTQRKINFGKSTNSHQLERSIGKFRIDKLIKVVFVIIPL